MRRARVNTATIGVFSWALLEPEEGKFEFGWLDDALDRLHGEIAGLDLPPDGVAVVRERTAHATPGHRA